MKRKNTPKKIQSWVNTSMHRLHEKVRLQRDNYLLKLTKRDRHPVTHEILDTE